MRRRQVYAARSVDGCLSFASASGQSVNRELVRGQAVVDVVPLAGGDPNGQALQQLVLGTILSARS